MTHDDGMGVRVGLMGAGSAGDLYLRHARYGCSLRYVACADVEPSRAAALARAHGGLRPCTPREMLANPEVDIVLNLTPAPEHGWVGRQVLLAHKHLYTEKPLAPDMRQGARLLAMARRRGLRVGAAPDTFLGRALQTARRLIDAGEIGAPFAAAATVTNPPPFAWHPRPAQFFGEAAGPLFDMGPYYLTALVFLLGPVARVAGFGTVAPCERASLTGERILPGVPTHEVGVLEFATGAVATLHASFDAALSAAPPIEVHGTMATLRLPDPDTSGGTLLLCPQGEREWTEVPLAPVGGRSRCIGIEDMAAAIREHRPHRACGELALHVLDVMELLRRSASAGRTLAVRTTCGRPAPLPVHHPELVGCL